MGTRFEVGDRVRVIRAWNSNASRKYAGKIGTVTETFDCYTSLDIVEWDGAFHNYELEKIRPLMTEDELTKRIDETNTLDLSIEKWERIIENWPYVSEKDIQSDTCGLCREYLIDIPKCKDCPLDKIKNCGHPVSPWMNVHKTILSEEMNIKYPKEMLETLKSLKTKFKVSEIWDKLKIGMRIKREAYLNVWTGQIYKINDHTIKYVKDDEKLNSLNVNSVGTIEILEEPKPISEYRQLRIRIETLNENSSFKEWDELWSIIKNNNHVPYISFAMGHGTGKVEIEDRNHNVLSYFPYKNHNEKINALKKCSLWLLDHSNIKKDLVGETVEVNIDEDDYKVKILEKI